MLIEFSVANFRSFRERQAFSLAKAKGNELLDNNTFTTEAVNKLHLLRSAAIYGPNAGGKSNFLLALKAMRTIVLESATDMQRGDRLPVTSFLLCDSTRREPSEFELTFIVNKIRYQYGFAATEGRIHEEWLFAFPRGRPQHWFGRTWNEQSEDYDWDLGKNLLGEKELWRKSTRGNALFLSTAVQLNSEQLQPIYDWFKDTLHMAGVSGWGVEFSASLCAKNKKIQIMDFLNKADLGIADIAVEEKTFDPTLLPDDMPEAIKKAVSEQMEGKKHFEIKMSHEDAKSTPVEFPFEAESDGTQKIFGFAGPWIDSLEKGNVLFIDELNTSLHPHLVKFLVQLFHNSETNPKNAQLIFTTHDTSILSQDVFRRDQIWFCEKGADQATTLYPLTDFNPRKGRNLELAYLSGRYGALPYVRPFRKRG